MTDRPFSLADTCIKPAPDFTRLLEVLRRGRKPDRIPFYELFVNIPVMETVIGKKIADRAGTIEFYYRTGYDYVPCWPQLPMETGSLVDRRGGYPITERADFERYPWPAAGAITYQELDSVGPQLPSGMKIIGQTGGIFERVEYLCGYETLCYLLVDDRPLVREIFARVGNLYEIMYEGMAGRADVGAIVISDDLGYKAQTLISPEDLREFVLPWHKRLADIAHAHGKPCILHSCGNLVSIMEDIIGFVGVDAKHSYEDTIVPVVDFKKRYGSRIAVLGGFDVDRLSRGTPDEVRRYTRYLLAEAGRDGGYALGSGNSIAEYVPVNNYLTMLDEGWRTT